MRKVSYILPFTLSYLLILGIKKEQLAYNNVFYEQQK